MAHEIRENDGLVVVKRPAWHGLGTVVQEAPSPFKALELAGLRWDVESCPLTALRGDDLQERISVSSHVANVRSDTGEVLGVVSDSYSVVQNETIADLIWKAAEDGACPKIESAGSLKNGRIVYFCARMKSMFIAGADEVVPYFVLTSGHDGSMALNGFGTKIRTECMNTHKNGTQEAKRAGHHVSLRHTSNVAGRVGEIRLMFDAIKEGVTVYEKKANALAKKNLTTSQLETFFTDVWQKAFGAIPSPTERDTKEGSRKYNRCVKTVSQWLNNYESHNCNANGIGGTAWAAYNAVTEWQDHQRTAKATSAHGNASNAARTYRRLVKGDFKDTVLNTALATI